MSAQPSALYGRLLYGRAAPRRLLERLRVTAAGSQGPKPETQIFPRSRSLNFCPRCCVAPFSYQRYHSPKSIRTRVMDRQTDRQFGRKTHSEQLGCCATHLGPLPRANAQFGIRSAQYES
eukprot:scaffold18767_cov54-Phaeocystis_antarctica.AAC.3